MGVSQIPAQEAEEETAMTRSRKRDGKNSTRRWRQSYRVRFNLKKAPRKGTPYTLMQRSHSIHISTLPPQSTAVLSHFRVCSKRLETLSLVLDRKICSLNIPPAIKFLLFGNYKTCLRKWIFSSGCFPLCQGTEKRFTFIGQPKQLAGILKSRLFVN